MKLNPGGNLAPQDVIGRDRLIQNLWRILERQSVVLSAERRMGKTSVMRKMNEEASENRLCFFHDLERVETPFEFVKLVFRDIEQYLTRKERLSQWTHKIFEQLSGSKLQGFTLPQVAEPHWKDLLAGIIKDLLEHQQQIVVFFWDEFPMMLQNFQKQNNDQAAMEVLNTLRYLRQTHHELRMVLSGSIGLHNVITHFKKQAYTNEPINDMRIQDVPPLKAKDAKDLATQLIAGEEIPVENLGAVASAVAQAVDGIPYYIQHILEQAIERDETLTLEGIDDIIQQGLVDPLDNWDMRHYRDRMDSYYSEEEKTVALAVLDALATSSEPISFSEVFNLIKSQVTTEDAENLRYVIKLLLQDHYLLQTKTGQYHFKYQLIQRWWILDRGLEL